MLQFIPIIDENIIAVRASGKLTHEDYQRFLPQLEDEINKLQKASLLLEFDNFSGWEIEAAKDDFKFALKHLSELDRIAVVGDKAWEHWMVLMIKPFLPFGKSQYFNRENLQDAWDWLREKQEMQKAAEQLRPYKHIVVAVDFSLQSIHACKRAIELAKSYKASVTLLNVTREMLAYPPYDDMGMYDTIPESLKEQNQQFMESAESQMVAFVANLKIDYPIETQVLGGEKDLSITSFLATKKADLVVFGAKKKKGIDKLSLSTPHYVQNHSRCELLIVPIPDSSL
ncbi:STAS/SEC14 domain-containing protein [Leucothrix arctica]|uniref:UspA domain-containing protein n=1 Tax=Leucothrix arctica TaxID=1481894 RepID=A0A317C678_9GAMM|nr:STAS/SEC14 domain-containing protein [Leucothrix arctica]PWQ93779.1 hypothetical protein DKT75_19435 [Leucothrix arctica]